MSILTPGSTLNSRVNSRATCKRTYRVPCRRASSCELQVRGPVPSGLLLEIDLRRTGAAGAIVVTVWRSERICFPEQPVQYT